MLAFGSETLHTCYQEIRGMLHSYLAEVTTAMPGEGKINWDYYLQASEQGYIHVISARDDGVLVGFLVFLITEHPNAKGTVVAQELAMYLRPEFRKGTNGLRLIKLAEVQSKNLGAECITITTRPGKDLGPLLQKLGYENHERPFLKRL